jgi:hypothetical protein
MPIGEVFLIVTTGFAVLFTAIAFAIALAHNTSRV